MKAGLYCRVSTDLQNEGYSIEAQKELLRSFCAAKEISEYEYYIDGGFTGSNIERPMLEALIADCKSNEIDIVIVYKLDRLSRSQKDTLYLIEEVFIPNGVDFISISENFDTTTPYGKAMIGILSVFAQLERETIKERTRMGMKERVKNGYWPGGGNLPFGYSYDSQQGILVPNQNAPVVKRMYEMYIDGMSADSIARHFSLKYERLVTQIIKSKANCGLIEYNGEVYEGRHEPIVTRELYGEAQSTMEKRKKNNIRSGKNMLTGLLYCGVCGAKMRYQKWGKKGHKICCYSQQSSKEYLIKDKDCTNQKYWAHEIEQAVVDELKQFALNPSLIAKRANEADDASLAKQVKEISDLRKKISKLLDLIVDGVAVEEGKQKIKDMENEIKRLNAAYISASEKSLRVEGFTDKVNRIDDVWDRLDAQEKRSLIIALVDKVVLNRNECDIFYTFEAQD
ncbi:MAG: recombinase family protein [Eubacteriaceae bacterium]|nr:recombinase family protein [Eubacteriaceae bacterium]